MFEIKLYLLVVSVALYFGIPASIIIIFSLALANL